MAADKACSVNADAISRSLWCMDEATHVITIAAELCAVVCPATESDEVAGASMGRPEYIPPAFVIL